MKIVISLMLVSNLSSALPLPLPLGLSLSEKAQSKTEESIASRSFTQDKYNQLLWSEKDHKEWYEWWYFKVVDPKTKKSFYFCYGLVNPWDKLGTRESSKVFVNAGNFSGRKIVEERFLPNQFVANVGKLKEEDIIFKAGSGNLIMPTSFHGDIISETNEHVSWSIQTKKTWSFNAMGWTMLIPEISNIYWYPAQANMEMSGWINFNGERIELDKAHGYQDRNWGRSFPKWWAWIVSNNFKDSPTTKLASGGGMPNIKGIGEVFEGFTLGVSHLGRDYKFRFPDGDKIKLDIQFGKWHVDAINKKNQRVIIDAFAPKEKFMLLPFTTPQGELYKDYEALNGAARLRIYERENFFRPWKLIADLETDEAGIEYGSFNELALQEAFAQSVHLQ